MRFYHRYKITKETIINLIKNEGRFRNKENFGINQDSFYVYSRVPQVERGSSIMDLHR